VEAQARAKMHRDKETQRIQFEEEARLREEARVQAMYEKFDAVRYLCFLRVLPSITLIVWYNGDGML
jgi:hypothetical protein